MSKFTKINCPMCGKTLIRLDAYEFDEELVNEYWCDDCDITIEISSAEYAQKDLDIENFI